MKGKKLKVAFVDNEKRVFSIDMGANDEISDAIKELIDELEKRLKK